MLLISSLKINFNIIIPISVCHRALIKIRIYIYEINIKFYRYQQLACLQWFLDEKIVDCYQISHPVIGSAGL